MTNWRPDSLVAEARTVDGLEDFGNQQFSLWLLTECYESYPCHFWRQQGIKIDIAAHFRFESG